MGFNKDWSVYTPPSDDELRAKLEAKFAQSNSRIRRAFVWQSHYDLDMECTVGSYRFVTADELANRAHILQQHDYAVAVYWLGINEPAPVRDTTPYRIPEGMCI